VLKIGPDEHDYSGDPNRQPALAAPRDAMVAQQQAIEHQKPERRHRNQQRRQAGGDDPLGVRKREVARPSITECRLPRNGRAGATKN
jgi:hypothetical protein